MEAFFEDEVNGNLYRFGRMKSEDGSWLLMRLMKQLLDVMSSGTKSEDEPTEQVDEVVEPTPEEVKEKAAQAINMLMLNLEEDLFKRVQKYALGCISRYEGTIQTPIPIMVNGKLVVKELQYDIEATMKLTSTSLYFNLSPFFSQSAFTSLLAKAF